MIRSESDRGKTIKNEIKPGMQIEYQYRRPKSLLLKPTYCGKVLRVTPLEIHIVSGIESIRLKKSEVQVRIMG